MHSPCVANRAAQADGSLHSLHSLDDLLDHYARGGVLSS
jgi:hypothetical protein